MLSSKLWSKREIIVVEWNRMQQQKRKQFFKYFLKVAASRSNIFSETITPDLRNFDAPVYPLQLPVWPRG